MRPAGHDRRATAESKVGISPRGGIHMPFYLVQGVYAGEGWSKLVQNPEDRFEAMRPVIDRLGGRLVDAWFAFGDYDVVLICDMPDNVSAAALAMAAAAGGAVKAVKTTPLMTVAEAIGALKLAARAGY